MTRKRLNVLIGGMSTLITKLLIKGGYSVDVSGSDENTVLREVVDNHVFRETKDNDKIGLNQFDCF